MTSSERRALVVVALWLAASTALDAWLARSPREISTWIGPAAVAELSGASSDTGAAVAPGAPDPKTPGVGERPATRRTADAYDAAGRLRLNRADSLSILALEGVGPVLAGRILAWRASRGPFRGPDDLGHVKGIGPATLARLLPQITFDGPPQHASDSLSRAARGDSLRFPGP